MRGRIGRRTKSRCTSGFDHIALQVEQYDLFRRQLFIADSAGLDGNDTLGTVYAADIAPGEEDKAVFLQLDIGIANLLFKLVIHRYALALSLISNRTFITFTIDSALSGNPKPS